MNLIITILPVDTKNVPISPRFTPYNFLSRCKFSNLTARQPKVEFYLLTFPRFPLRKKERKSYFGKNRTYDFRTSRCAGYLLDHSGDNETIKTRNPTSWPIVPMQRISSSYSSQGCLLDTSSKRVCLKTVLVGCSDTGRVTKRRAAYTTC